jgi:hypothetical protein
MAFAVVGFVGFLLLFGLVIFAAWRLRPETFRFKATLTKWVSLDLEMRSPRRDQSEQPADAIERKAADLRVR